MHRKLIALTTLAVSLGGCGEKSDEAFNKSFDESFVQSCVSSSTRSGVPGDIADRVCNCAVNDMNGKYSAMEKATLSDEQLNAVMKKCANEAMKTNG